MAEIAQIREVREIPLADLEIGRSQVRTANVGMEIDELAASIARVGLLEPIVVCPSETQGKYEIVTGQRRFLAHVALKRDAIRAVILDKPISELDATVISLTENLIRRDLSSREKVDACTELYKKYGSITAVCEATGLPRREVNQYVKYESLSPGVRALFDKGEVKLDAALKAQRAAEVQGGDVEANAVKLAVEMNNMSGAQRSKLQKDVEQTADPDKVDELIEQAKSGSKITQIVVTITAEMHNRLRAYADGQGMTQDDAAANLLSGALDKVEGDG